MPQSTQKVSLLVVGLLLGCVVLATLFTDGDKASQIEDESSLIETNLMTLQSSTRAAERLAAARFFAERPPLLKSADWQKLSIVLVADPDPALRAAIARSIGASRRKLDLSAGVQYLKEPQVIEMLAAAYEGEEDPAVRREIVIAAGEFNHADAAGILTTALEDSDPSVREQALRTRNDREKRMLKVRLG